MAPAIAAERTHRFSVTAHRGRRRFGPCWRGRNERIMPQHATVCAQTERGMVWKINPVLPCSPRKIEIDRTNDASAAIATGNGAMLRGGGGGSTRRKNGGPFGA